MPRKVVLHIGTHKTGTTSLQHFLHSSPSLLSKSGAFYPPGFVLETAHSELPLITVRPELDWPARLRFPEVRQTNWLTAARNHVRKQLKQSSGEVLVYSHEDLSYLRFEDEFIRLTDLLADAQVRVIVFLRDKAGFLRSYGDQLQATGFPKSDNPSSFAYLESDSWLIDYDALLAGYRQAFGPNNVEVYDYDEVLKQETSIIPMFAELLGIHRSSLPALDHYFLNRAGTHLRPTDDQLAAIRRRLADQGR